MSWYAFIAADWKVIPVNRPPQSMFSPGLLPGALAASDGLSDGAMIADCTGCQEQEEYVRRVTRKRFEVQSTIVISKSIGNCDL